MNENPYLALSIEGVGKRYTIGHQRASGDGMRHVIESAMRSPIKWLRSKTQGKVEQVDFWALKDVSIQIKHGEVVGLLGKNEPARVPC